MAIKTLRVFGSETEAAEERLNPGERVFRVTRGGSVYFAVEGSANGARTAVSKYLNDEVVPVGAKAPESLEARIAKLTPEQRQELARRLTAQE